MQDRRPPPPTLGIILGERLFVDWMGIAQRWPSDHGERGAVRKPLLLAGDVSSGTGHPMNPIKPMSLYIGYPLETNPPNRFESLF